MSLIKPITINIKIFRKKKLLTKLFMRHFSQNLIKKRTDYKSLVIKNINREFKPRKYLYRKQSSVNKNYHLVSLKGQKLFLFFDEESVLGRKSSVLWPKKGQSGSLSLPLSSSLFPITVCHPFSRSIILRW